LRWNLRIVSRRLAGMLATGAATLMVMAPAAQAQTTIGPETKLPLPRFVSLKTDKVNLREGPSKDHRTRWVFQRAGLPVEIIAEFENWRRIRDSEGADGWVWHSLLSGRRTALVSPWEKPSAKPLALREAAEENAAPIALLQPGVVAGVKRCGDSWCRLTVTLPSGGLAEGYMPQDKLWGVYPNESVD
jgi:SH3-like domain-containing protein